VFVKLVCKKKNIFLVYLRKRKKKWHAYINCVVWLVLCEEDYVLKVRKTQIEAASMKDWNILSLSLSFIFSFSLCVCLSLSHTRRRKETMEL
jgi:hypothetical protein